MSDWYVSSAAWTAIAQFAASGAYTVGQIVRPLTAPAFAAQFAFRCTTAGTASTEPAWPATNNATVTTGGATFTNVTGQAAYGWSAAAGNLFCLTGGGGAARQAIGDRFFLSSDHTETNTAANSYGYSGGPGGYGVIQFISVNRAGSVPPAPGDTLSGATIYANGSGQFTFDNPTNTYWQGVTINFGGTCSALSFGLNGSRGFYLRNCAINFTTSTTTAYIIAGNPTNIVLDNTTLQFNNAGQYIRFINFWDFRWLGGSFLGTAPTTLFNIFQPSAPITCRGVDLSVITTALFTSGSNTVKALFDSCRIASGVTRISMSAPTLTDDEVELVNCYDGTNIIAERHTNAGDLTTNRSTTLVGGAQDDVGLFSHQMVSSSRADMLSMTLDGFWMDVENTYVGSTRTATVEIVSSASLNTTDISLTLEYLGTSGSSLAAVAGTLANALTAAAALPTSTATWNSPPSTPVYQHIQTTFTPQQAGRVRGVVRLGKPSTTVYLNPQIIVT